MKNKYVKGWGILVGTFDQTDIKCGDHKIMLEKYKKKYPQYKCINTKLIKDKNITKIAIYICDRGDVNLIF